MVAAGELGNPVTVLVSVVADDRALHGVRLCRGTAPPGISAGSAKP